MNKNLWIPLGAALLIVGIVVLVPKKTVAPTLDTNTTTSAIPFAPREGTLRFVQASTSVSYTSALNEEDQARGLSGRPSLDVGSGLLFVMDNDDYHGIWMKDMRFAIDIIWFNTMWKITGIKQNALPSSYPEVFVPEEPSRYMLEVNAGFVKAHGLKVGDTASLQE